MFFTQASLLSVVTRANGFTMRGYCLVDKNQNILSQDDLFEQTLLCELSNCPDLSINSLFDTTISFSDLLSQTASRKVVPAIHRPTGDRYQLEIVPLPTDKETLFVVLVEGKSQAIQESTDTDSDNVLVVGERPSDLDPFFEVSPLPMWIFNTDTLRFVAVNEAAVKKYGWSRQEFMSMTILDIRPESERERVERIVSGCFTRVGRSGPWKHQDRLGKTWSVDALTHAVTFKGMPCRLVKVLDAPAEVVAGFSIDQAAKGGPSLTVIDARETRIVEMKKEINELLCALGREPKFRSVLN